MAFVTEFEALLAETGDREEAADPDKHRFHIPLQHIAGHCENTQQIAVLVL